MRFLSVAGGRKGARLIVSGALPRHGQSNWLDRCLIRSASRVLALGGFDATRYRALGLKEDRLLVAAPAIVAPPETSTSTMPAFPPNARVILCIGPITWLKGYRDAVWALDILNHLDDVHHLVFVGPAPEADKIARFARAIDAENRVRFVGPVASLGPWLQRADVVWVPSWKGDGTGAALEALATGKPVVASRWPALAEIVVDGETGFLIPAEDKAALAKQTHKILSDPEMARRMGTAGRLRALDVFSPQRLVERCAALYD